MLEVVAEVRRCVCVAQHRRPADRGAVGMAQMLSAVIDTLHQRRGQSKQAKQAREENFTSAASMFVHDPTKPRSIFFWGLMRQLHAPKWPGPKALAAMRAQFAVFNLLIDDMDCCEGTSDAGVLFGDASTYLPVVVQYQYAQEPTEDTRDVAQYEGRRSFHATLNSLWFLSPFSSLTTWYNCCVLPFQACMSLPLGLFVQSTELPDSSTCMREKSSASAR